MATWTALTHTAGREAADALVELCEDLTPEPVGSGVFEIEDGSNRWEVGLYFTEAPDEVALALLAAAWGAPPFAISELPEVDWVAHVKRELAPVEAGRFFVYGAHDKGRVPANVQGLAIEAGAAFGTGHHGTTVGCLEAFDNLLKTETFEKVLDVGCGTGVLAIAAAKTGSPIAVGTDIDEPSARIANENALINDAKCEFYFADGLSDARIAQHAPYDLVFANILAAPLVFLAPEIGQALKSGGVAILSGLLRTQEERILEAYLPLGFVVEQTIHHDAWTALQLRKK